MFLAPSDAKVAYTQGSVDAWSTWEPYVSQEEVLFQSRPVITAEGLTPGLGFQVASPDAIRDKRPRTGRFPAPADGGPRLVAEQCRRLCRDLGQADEHSARRAAQLAEPGKDPVAPIDDGVVADEQKTIDLYFRAGLIKQKLNAADIVDRSFADAIGKGAGL